MTEDVIRCRAKYSSSCYDGSPVTSSVYVTRKEMELDGTWDGETVVCDPCYLAMGQPSVPIEHPEARGYGPSIAQGDPRGER